LLLGGIVLAVVAGIGMWALIRGYGNSDNRTGTKPVAATTPARPPKIRIELLQVSCSNTEDDIGDDEFYVVGGSSLPATQYAPAAGWGTVAPPIKIGDDNTWHTFSQGKVFFDGPAAGVKTVHIVAAAYDQDSDGFDWGDTGNLTSAVGQRLATSNNPKVAAGGQAADTAGEILTVIASIRALDGDDELGTYDKNVPLLGPASEILTWTIDHQAGLLGSSYHYDVQIKVTRYV